MAAALYGDGGFFVRPDSRPAGHFRTSAHASPLFAGALLTLLERLDAALGRPEELAVVDIGAGHGELLSALLDAAGPELASRLRPTAVERAPGRTGSGPAGPGPGGATRIAWRGSPPARLSGLLLATEWLDNIPVDVAERDPTGTVRYVLVDPATGAEALGDPVSGPDADWLARWWPLTVPGTRAEIGLPRDQAWAAAVGGIDRGAALAVDYGHRAADRPPLGTLTGFRYGREVPPVPDGSCDLTAHVALDAVAAAPGRAGAVTLRQARALRALGVTGARPPLALAHADPAGYLRRLAAAGAAGELTELTGLGGHWWLLQPVGLAEDVARWLA
jgi:SAM-dependent MidA family methyltransferase